MINTIYPGSLFFKRLFFFPYNLFQNADLLSNPVCVLEEAGIFVMRFLKWVVTAQLHVVV